MTVRNQKILKKQFQAEWRQSESTLWLQIFVQSNVLSASFGGVIRPPLWTMVSEMHNLSDLLLVIGRSVRHGIRLQGDPFGSTSVCVARLPPTSTEPRFQPCRFPGCCFSNSKKPTTWLHCGENNKLLYINAHAFQILGYRTVQSYAWLICSGGIIPR